ncbi:MAG TPA: EF-hand domain-containing protein [bacterium]|nr:EF-hand domain-containing protein [bacterium]
MPKTALPRKDRRLLRRLRRSFRQIAGRQQQITAPTLKQILGIRDDALFARFFALFDADGNGTIDEEEFLAGLGALMSSSETERLRFLFRLHDERDKGYITRPQFTKLMEMILAEHNLNFGRRTVNDLAWALFREADKDGNGSISFEEFRDVLTQHPEASGGLALEVSDWISPSRRLLRQRRPRIRRPPLLRRLMRAWQNDGMPNFFLFLYLLANALLFLNAQQRYAHAGANLAIQIARGGGACLNFNGALILVPVMRNLLTWVRRVWLGRIVPVDLAIDFHKLAGQFMFFFALVHTGAHFTNYWILSGKPLALQPAALGIAGYLEHTKAGLTGAILLGVFAVMWLCAQNFVRRSGHFEIFALTHALYVAWFVLMLLHGPVFWMWATVPLAGYVIERWFRWRSAKLRTGIEDVRLYPSGVTNLRITRPETFDYAPADYVFLKIPSVSHFEWHPFTISSSPLDPDIVGIHVRSLGNWTRMVHKRFEGRDPETKYKPVPIVLDGPYGTPSLHIFESTHAILIGAGIGATPFASILRTIQLKNHRREPMKLQHVHFIWLNRGQQSFEWFLEILAEVQRRRINDLIDISIYMTDVKRDLKSSTLNLAMDLMFAEKGSDPVTGLRSQTHFGHPDWHAVFADFSERYRKEKVDVYFCGPPGLASTLRPLCRRAGFRFRKENF